jgi:hypothetical protein
METKTYSIEKISEYGYQMTINTKGNNEYTNILASMMKKMIKNSFFDYETTSMYFTCETVMTLSCYVKYHHFKIPYDKCLIMIDNLTQQMNLLKANNYSFYGFDIDDIIVIDNTLFIFAGTTYLQNLINDSIFFYTPIHIPYFFNPELVDIDCLPSEINYKACYYSLGVLVVFCLFNNYLLVGNEIKSELDIESVLKPIYNTKLYWFLKRCMYSNVEKRSLLLI